MHLIPEMAVRRSVIRRIAGVILIGARAITALSVARPASHAQAAQTLKSTVRPGQLAPDFSARTLTGRKLRLSGLRGKVVLLDFWMTT